MEGIVKVRVQGVLLKWGRLLPSTHFALASSNWDRKLNESNLSYLIVSFGFNSKDATYIIKPFHTTGLFLYPLKISENPWSSDVFRGCRKRQMAWNEFRCFKEERSLGKKTIFPKSFSQGNCLPYCKFYFCFFYFYFLKGFERVYNNMDDIVLDIPRAHKHLDNLLNMCCRADVISLGLRQKAPFRLVYARGVFRTQWNI